MKKLAIALLICSASAFADTATYTTSGIFSLTGTNSISSGDATLLFTGISTPGTTVGLPSFSNLGTFTESTTGGVAGSFSGHFTLYIDQTSPTNGTVNTVTPVSGMITGDSSNVELVFAPSSMTIGRVTYTLFPDNSYGLNGPATDGGQTTIQVDITESAAVPEPVSIGLLYGSALGLGLLIRRRVAK